MLIGLETTPSSFSVHPLPLRVYFLRCPRVAVSCDLFSAFVSFFFLLAFSYHFFLAPVWEEGERREVTSGG